MYFPFEKMRVFIIFVYLTQLSSGRLWVSKIRSNVTRSGPHVKGADFRGGKKSTNRQLGAASLACLPGDDLKRRG